MNMGNLAKLATPSLLLRSATVLLLCSGCSSMSNTDKGLLAGGAVGAGTGAIVGRALGNTGAGALVGAGVGAISGGLVGAAVDNSEKKAEARAVAAAVQSRPPLGMTDVAQMAQQHVSDEVIINQIRSTGSVYQLSSNDTIWLKQQSVSDAVINEMLATATRVPRRVYAPTPVYAQPVYVVEEPPPVRVGFGVGYYGGRRW